MARVQKVEGNESIRDLPVVQDLLHEAYRYRVNPSSVKNIRSTPRTGHQFNPEQSHASITLSDDKLTVCSALTLISLPSLSLSLSPLETQQTIH